MKETQTNKKTSIRLAEMCWPVIEFVTNFVRQVKHGATPPPDQVRFEAVTALRDSEDRSQDDGVTERAWKDRVKAMMVYLVDYKMLNTEWAGRDYWLDKPFETDPIILDHAESVGGEEFFHNCEEVQREYETAQERGRPDQDELAGLLSLYFICLRLGFKGQYGDRPQELADYTRRLWERLPAFAKTRTKEMFPAAYQHNQEIKVEYNLARNLTIVVVTFLVIIGLSLLTFRVGWTVAVRGIQQTAETWESGGVGTGAAEGMVADTTTE